MNQLILTLSNCKEMINKFNKLNTSNQYASYPQAILLPYVQSIINNKNLLIPLALFHIPHLRQLSQHINSLQTSILTIQHEYKNKAKITNSCNQATSLLDKIIKQIQTNKLCNWDWQLLKILNELKLTSVTILAMMRNNIRLNTLPLLVDKDYQNLGIVNMGDKLILKNCAIQNK